MFLLFDISKEHSILPVQEIISVIKSYHISFSILANTHNAFIIELDSTTEIISLLSSRLAFTNCIAEFLFSSPPEPAEIRLKSQEHPILIPGTIAIRYRNRSKNQDSQEIIKSLAGIYTKNRDVDLDKPDHEIYVIITDETIYVGKILSVIERRSFNKRKVQHRPFFSPISLHPRLARAFVNISNVTSKSVVLDPFCGTGGFLIEAGLIGCKLYGSDIQHEMIEGTRMNLASHQLKACGLYQSDIGEIHQKINTKIDAVITDAPYGKSTTTKKEPLQSLYIRTFESISNLLSKNGFVVIGLPDQNYRDIFEQFFQLQKIIHIPVHRSLTRYFYVGIKNEP